MAELASGRKPVQMPKALSVLPKPFMCRKWVLDLSQSAAVPPGLDVSYTQIGEDLRGLIGHVEMSVDCNLTLDVNTQMVNNTSLTGRKSTG